MGNELKIKELLESARALSPVDRATLLEQIYETFESSQQKENDAKWAREAESRLKAFREGKLDAEPVEQAMSRINRTTDS